MRNFFLIKHHLQGLLGVYQENPIHIKLSLSSWTGCLQ